MQAPVEKELDEEETWRNGKRLNQLYVGPANLVVPDIYELGSRAEQAPNEQHSTPMDPQLTGIKKGRHECPVAAQMSRRDTPRTQFRNAEERSCTCSDLATGRILA